MNTFNFNRYFNSNRVFIANYNFDIDEDCSNLHNCVNEYLDYKRTKKEERKKIRLEEGEDKAKQTLSSRMLFVIKKMLLHTGPTISTKEFGQKHRINLDETYAAFNELVVKKYT